MINNSYFSTDPQTISILMLMILMQTTCTHVKCTNNTFHTVFQMYETSTEGGNVHISTHGCSLFCLISVMLRGQVKCDLGCHYI